MARNVWLPVNNYPLRAYYVKRRRQSAGLHDRRWIYAPVVAREQQPN